MPVTIADGVPVLNSSNVVWRLTAGVEPVRETFDVRPDDAADLALLANRGEPVSLDIVGPRESFRVENLFITNFLPGDNPNIVRVELSDIRWKWAYKHVVRDYNIHRRSGYRRRQSQWNNDLQVDVTDDVILAPWSLNPRTKRRWTADEMLMDVLKSEDAIGLADNLVVDRTGGPAFFRNYSIDDVSFDDKGTDAVSRALAVTGGVNIYVNAAGQVVIFNKMERGEDAGVLNLEPYTVGSGAVTEVTNELTRPSKVICYFDREVEVRFDFFEADDAQFVGGTVAGGGLADRVIDNVIPAPDFETLMPDGRIVTQGTWITVDEALAAWSIRAGITLTPSLLQKAFIPEMDLWTGLQLYGMKQADGDQANWIARFSTLQQHYRRTFRIRKEWVDRIKILKAYLVATIDPVFGDRAPAVAFSDFAYKASQKAVFRQSFNGAAATDLTYATNVFGYPRDGRIDQNVEPAPAEVSVVDEDQGIIRVDYIMDPYNLQEVVFPGLLQVGEEDPTKTVDFAIPSQNGRDFLVPVSFDSVGRGNVIPKLASSHRIAVVLTAVPAAPNSLNRLHPVTINSGDPQLRKMLPRNIQEELSGGRALGPVMHVRIGAGTETARTRWNDDNSVDIEKLFGVQPGDPNMAIIRKLTINDREQTEVDDQNFSASLTAIARAAAAKIYIAERDGFQGSAAGDLNPRIVPDGNLDEVQHVVMPDGSTLTQLSLRPPQDTLSVFAMMNGSARRLILKQVK